MTQVMASVPREGRRARGRPVAGSSWATKVVRSWRRVGSCAMVQPFRSHRMFQNWKWPTMVRWSSGQISKKVWMMTTSNRCSRETRIRVFREASVLIITRHCRSRAMPKALCRVATTVSQVHRRKSLCIAIESTVTRVWLKWLARLICRRCC